MFLYITLNIMHHHYSFCLKLKLNTKGTKMQHIFWQSVIHEQYDLQVGKQTTNKTN